MTPTGDRNEINYTYNSSNAVNYAMGWSSLQKESN